MAGIWTMGEMLVEIMRPRAGMPLHQAAEFIGPFPSGAPAIFIDTVSRLGHPAGIIGGVGEDDFGRCLLGRLEADGVDCDRVQRIPHKSTAVAFVAYAQDGSRQFIFHIDGTPAVLAESGPLDNIDPPAFFHIMGCSLMVNETYRENILQAMARFHEMGAKISFDPNIRPELLGERQLVDLVESVMEHCSVLLPGTNELSLLTGEQSTAESISRVFNTWPVETIVVKRGKEGCTIFTSSEEIDVPAYPVVEIDPTGAGDCFDAAFICGLEEGQPLVTCGQMAAAAGALNAAAFGPMEGDLSPASLDEVMQKGYVDI